MQPPVDDTISGQEPALSIGIQVHISGAEPGSRYEYALYDLMLALNSNKPDDREAAIMLLAESGKRAVPAIIRAATENRRNARIAAATAIGLLPEIQLLSPLKQLLLDSDDTVRYRATVSLFQFEVEDIWPTLRDAQYNGILSDVRHYLSFGKLSTEQAEKVAQTLERLGPFGYVNIFASLIAGFSHEHGGNNITLIFEAMSGSEARLALLNTMWPHFETYNAVRLLLNVIQETGDSGVLPFLYGLRDDPPRFLFRWLEYKLNRVIKQLEQDQ